MTTLLLTNDDGWNAPGLEALRQASEGLGDCLVIAPEEPHSGCGHRVTTHGPIWVRRPTPDHVAVAGTPVDCVRLALHHLARGQLGLLRNQSGRQSGHRRSSFRDRGCRS